MSTVGSAADHSPLCGGDGGADPGLNTLILYPCSQAALADWL